MLLSGIRIDIWDYRRVIVPVSGLLSRIGVAFGIEFFWGGVVVQDNSCGQRLGLLSGIGVAVWDWGCCLGLGKLFGIGVAVWYWDYSLRL